MTTRVYTLFPYGGSFSCRTADYCGTEYTVAATSIRQAYAVAHQRVWINSEAEHPVGIVSIYAETAAPHCGAAAPGIGSRVAR